MKKRVLYITTYQDDSPVKTGRASLSNTHIKILKNIPEIALSIFMLPKAKASLRRLWGYLDGLSGSSIQSVIDTITTQNITTVYIDGSNLGVLVGALKRQFPELVVITFFHNVEAHFFWGAFKKSVSLRSFLVMWANYYAERKSVKCSDSIITLNERDSILLNTVYHREASALLPMIISSDFNSQDIPHQESICVDKYCLFVGGAFYANLDGVRWYAKNVAPFVSIKTLVVGKGFERYKEALEENKNIVVVGGVDNLYAYYYYAHFVIAPIFGGAGMKTKVAEALMYGKYVAATSEAMIGYENAVPNDWRACNTAEMFVSEINKKVGQVLPATDYKLQCIYQHHFSVSAAEGIMSRILL